ncbi:hypothetical protein LX36DRAFT_320412 [Colletotrichum falcatum]|nr:hypothetical protein LX36DRAFT_320412 [Colletotrichum falcatum]
MPVVDISQCHILASWPDPLHTLRALDNSLTHLSSLLAGLPDYKICHVQRTNIVVLFIYYFRHLSTSTNGFLPPCEFLYVGLPIDRETVVRHYCVARPRRLILPFALVFVCWPLPATRAWLLPATRAWLLPATRTQLLPPVQHPGRCALPQSLLALPRTLPPFFLPAASFPASPSFLPSHLATIAYPLSTVSNPQTPRRRRPTGPQLRERADSTMDSPGMPSDLPLTTGLRAGC